MFDVTDPTCLLVLLMLWKTHFAATLQQYTCSYDSHKEQL